MNVISFRPQIMTSKCPPQRGTNPRSRWRDVLNSMKPGHWFEFPANKVQAVRCAANKYTRGRYSVYQHPKKDGMYIYVRIK
jgi:hypothetical protein